MSLSLISLLLANASMYYFAKTEHWSVSTIFLAYWIQSVIIGFFQVLRILRLQKFSVKGVSIHGSAIPNTPQAKYKAKNFIAGFFVLHYGIFHVSYLVFILMQFFGPFRDIGGVTIFGVTISGLFLTSLIFFVNHSVSFLTNKEDREKEQNLGTLMITPYMRVIPMHLTIILGAALKIPLEIFVILKTLVDILSHWKQHDIKVAVG